MLTTLDNKVPMVAWQEDKEEIDWHFFFDMFVDKMEQKIPSLPLIPQESDLFGTKNYRIWKVQILTILDSYDL